MTLGYSSLTCIFQSEGSSLAKHLYNTQKNLRILLKRHMVTRQFISEYTSRQKTNKVPQTMIIDETSILSIKFFVKMLSFQFRGGLRMTSLSTGSTPRLKNRKNK